MTATTAAFVLFIASLLIPSTGFALGRVFGVPSARLSWVMLGFWLPAVGAGVLAGVSLLREPTTGAGTLLLAEAALAGLLVVPKVLIRLRTQVGNILVDHETTRSGRENEREGCAVQLVNQGGGSVPWSRSGKSGYIGWLFGVANYCQWTLTLDVSVAPSSVTGYAAATGSFVAWHSLTFTHRTAASSATGNAWCDPASGCAADAQGGQDQDTDVDYSSAVLIKGSSNGQSAALEVELAAAVAGQVAISQITVGIQGQNVKVGTAISVPATANDSKLIARTYSYRCSKAPTS